MKTRVQAHVAYRLIYHVIWITKFRKEVLISGVAEYTDKVIRSTTSDSYPDVVIEELNIRQDHIHMLAVIPPKYSISNIVRVIKSETSRKLRKEFEYLRKYDSLWSIGYFVGSVGMDEQRIRSYVKYQEEQDKGQAELA